MIVEAYPVCAYLVMSLGRVASAEERAVASQSASTYDQEEFFKKKRASIFFRCGIYGVSLVTAWGTWITAETPTPVAQIRSSLNHTTCSVCRSVGRPVGRSLFASLPPSLRATPWSLLVLSPSQGCAFVQSRCEVRRDDRVRTHRHVVCLFFF